MQIDLGGLIVEARGKLGGTSYTRNLGGYYSRKWSNPVNPQTSAQQENRALIASSVLAWRNLSENQRQSWSVMAEQLKPTNVFGDAFKYSPYNCFIKLNSIYRLCNATDLAACEHYDIPYNLNSLSAFINYSAQLITISVASLSFTNSKIIIYATQPLSIGVSRHGNRLRRIGVFDYAGLTSEAVTQAYINYFGTFPPEGKKVIFAARTASTLSGLTSMQLITSAVSQATTQYISPYNLYNATYTPATRTLVIASGAGNFAALHAIDWSKTTELSFTASSFNAYRYLWLCISNIDTHHALNNNVDVFRFGASAGVSYSLGYLSGIINMASQLPVTTFKYKITITSTNISMSIAFNGVDFITVGTVNHSFTTQHYITLVQVAGYASTIYDISLLVY